MAEEHQKVIRGTVERIYMQFYDADDTLIDPTSATLSVYDNTGAVITDADSVVLSGVAPTKESIGLWYWEFKPVAGQSLGVASAWWRGKIDGEPSYKKQAIEIISEPTAGISLSGFSLPSDVRFILKAASPELDYDDELIYGFIKMADDQIKQDLYRAYDLSEFSASVPRVKAMSQWKAAELLLRSVFAANMTQNISDWAENYRTQYEEIRNGALAVGAAYSPILTASGVPLSRNNLNQFKSTTEGYHETFDMEDAEDQLVDPDRLDDESLDRQ